VVGWPGAASRPLSLPPFLYKRRPGTAAAKRGRHGSARAVDAGRGSGPHPPSLPLQAGPGTAATKRGRRGSARSEAGQGRRRGMATTTTASGGKRRSAPRHCLCFSHFSTPPSVTALATAPLLANALARAGTVGVGNHAVDSPAMAERLWIYGEENGHCAADVTRSKTTGSPRQCATPRPSPRSPRLHWSARFPLPRCRTTRGR